VQTSLLHGPPEPNVTERAHSVHGVPPAWISFEQARTSVEQAISTARDTAALARRVVLRTLTVIGGAAAGTAIAWCLSTAGAAADTGATPSPEVPVVSTVVSPAVSPMAGALDPAMHGALDKTAGELSDAAPAKAVEELGDRVEDAAGGLRELAEEQLSECADPLCGLAELGRSEIPSAGAEAGRSETPPRAPAVAPHATGKVVAPGIDPDRTAERTATGRAYSDGMPRRGSPAPGMPSVPAPLAPAAPAPAAEQNGSAGNPADSSLFAASPWRDRAPALVHEPTVPTTVVTLSERVGAQPGVSPD
jgi:hypothetical protein